MPRPGRGFDTTHTLPPAGLLGTWGRLLSGRAKVLAPRADCGTAQRKAAQPGAGLLVAVGAYWTGLAGWRTEDAEDVRFLQDEIGVRQVGIQVGSRPGLSAESSQVESKGDSSRIRGCAQVVFSD